MAKDVLNPAIAPGPATAGPTAKETRRSFASVISLSLVTHSQSTPSNTSSIYDIRYSLNIVHLAPKCLWTRDFSSLYRSPPPMKKR